MLLLLHGDDITTSRKYFQEQKQKNTDSISLEGEQITVTDLIQTFASDGLFTVSKTVFIEQLLTKKRKSKELDEIIKIINKYAPSHTIFLWEGKELEKNAMNPFKSADIKIFKLPQTLFTFLDNLKPNNSNILLSLFHQTLENTEVEMIFFMINRHVRLLLALSEKSNNSIDELKRMAPWQRSKLERQAETFGRKQLLFFHKRLFQIETMLKTGTLSSSFVATIDFLLAYL